MKEIIIEIEDKEYKVLVAETQEEKTQGLSGYTEMPSDGMLFDYSSDLQDSLTFNTIEMNFPIDIIFINDDDEKMLLIKSLFLLSSQYMIFFYFYFLLYVELIH